MEAIEAIRNGSATTAEEGHTATGCDYVLLLVLFAVLTFKILFFTSWTVSHLLGTVINLMYDGVVDLLLMPILDTSSEMVQVIQAIADGCIWLGRTLFQDEDTVWLILGILVNFFNATLAVTFCQMKTRTHEYQFSLKLAAYRLQDKPPRIEDEVSIAVHRKKEGYVTATNDDLATRRPIWHHRSTDGQTRCSLRRRPFPSMHSRRL
jgi:hypothetical protein